MRQHGLAGRMTGACNKKGGCNFPAALVYESSAHQLEDHADTSNSAMNFVVNQFHAAALGTTKALEESTACYLCASFLLPPPQSEVFPFIERKVAPAVAAQAAIQEEQVAAQVKANNNATYTCFDAAHHSQRNAQQSAGALGELNTQKMLKVVVDCEGPSERQEAKMLVAANAHCDALRVDQACCNLTPSPCHGWDCHCPLPTAVGTAAALSPPPPSPCRRPLCAAARTATAHSLPLSPCVMC